MIPDKPILRLNVASADFEQKLGEALQNGYELFAICGMYMVLRKKAL